MTQIAEANIGHAALATAAGHHGRDAALIHLVRHAQNAFARAKGAGCGILRRGGRVSERLEKLLNIRHPKFQAVTRLKTRATAYFKAVSQGAGLPCLSF